MLALDFIVAFGSVILGVVCALFVNRFSKTKKENKIKASGDMRSEFNNLVFERDVALEALDKVNRFFDEKKIDSFEKDRLLLKYGKLLEYYDERIFKLQPSVEIQDMYQYRNQLYSLMSNSVTILDKKLDSFSEKFGYFKEGDNDNKPNFDSVPPISQKTNPDDRKPDTATTAKNNDDRDSNSNSDSDSLSSFLSKARHNGFGLPGPGENPPMIYPNAGNNDDDATSDGSNTKSEDLSLNVEDIDKIHQDILKILKRLENPSG
jgi:hypothetical protein